VVNALWVVVTIGIPAGVCEFAWVTRLAVASPSDPSLLAIKEESPRVRSNTLTGTLAIGDFDPFRLDHYTPLPKQAITSTESAPPTKLERPFLLLVGTIGRQGDWQAFVEGIPGVRGVARLHANQKVGAVRVLLVARDTVVLMGLDTTWRLTLPSMRRGSLR
jgi:hypothetical protein